MKILVVGNGPSALSKKLGEEIDNFDGLVARFNSYRIEGYEEFVGTRTDVWITTDCFPAWAKRCEYTKVYFMTFDMRDDVPKFDTFKEMLPQAERFPAEVWHKAARLMGYTGTSSGAVAMTQFVEEYDEVFFYGFDFFKADRHHYADSVGAGNLHRALHEEYMFRVLMQQGKAKPFKDYIPCAESLYVYMHDTEDNYGTGGGYFSTQVAEIMNSKAYESVIDFGCGKGGMIPALAAKLPEGCDVVGYDPYSYERFQDMPVCDFDMLVSTDMLEHVPEQDIPVVLGQMHVIRPQEMFLVISNRPAVLKMPDGSDPHATVKSPRWWHEVLENHLKGYKVWQTFYNEKNKFSIFEARR